MKLMTSTGQILVTSSGNPISAPLVEDGGPVSGVGPYIPPTTAQLLAGSVVVPTSGQKHQDRTGVSDRTWDARAWEWEASSNYPIDMKLEGSRYAARQAWIGGKFSNTNPEEWTWRTLKGDYDGVGIYHFVDKWGLLDGFRCRNVMDPIRIKPPATFDPAATYFVRNVWTEYVRDDVIENDTGMNMEVSDCLFDGVYCFYSHQDGHWDGVGDGAVFENVLVRIEEMPFTVGDYSTPRNPNWVPTEPDHACHIAWKMQARTKTPITVRNSIFWIPNQTIWDKGSMKWSWKNSDGSVVPTVWENNLLLWTGGGSYPGVLPPSGVTVITDPEDCSIIWEAAEADWKVRHGVVDFDVVDMDMMLNPDTPPDPMSFVP